MNTAFDKAMARLVKEPDSAKWDGEDVTTVVMTARHLQLERRMLNRRLGLARNAPWSAIITRLEKFLPCRECGLTPRADEVPHHKVSCLAGAEEIGEYLRRRA